MKPSPLSSFLEQKWYSKMQGQGEDLGSGTNQNFLGACHMEGKLVIL